MTAGRQKDRMEASRGFALLVVLWFLVAIALIGTYLTAHARSETLVARNVLTAARAEALADAGIAQAAFNLTELLGSDRWKLDGTPYRVVLPSGEVTIRLHDEAGKINPNRASGALLSALFEVAGVDRARARTLGAAVAGWVRPRMGVRQPGADNDEQYRDAGTNYGPRHAAIESLDELQLVPGMTPEFFASVRSYLTIYTTTDRPEGSNPPPLVRQAVSLATQQSDVRNQSIDNSHNVPEAGTTAPANMTPADKPAPTIVDIEVRSEGSDGGIFIRHAVIKVEPDAPNGYRVLDWHRDEVAN